jgi:SAM-dependent methyltransferase
MDDEQGARGMSQNDALARSYDRVSRAYCQAFFDELSRKPFDRELLDAYAARTTARGRPGAVWDIGCGPGHVGRYLFDRDVPVVGLDLSPRMLDCARELNPDIVFVQGDMLALPVAPAELPGIVSFYAIIHLPRAQAPAALREFARALQPAGELLLAFHGGDGEVHTEEWFGEPVDVSATLYQAEEMAAYARDAGLTVLNVLQRPPYPFEYQSQRVYLLAAKPDELPTPK